MVKDLDYLPYNLNFHRLHNLEEFCMGSQNCCLTPFLWNSANLRDKALKEIKLSNAFADL
jgi:hypothetical protein